MIIYIIHSNYFPSGDFGTYSSVKRARIAFENFLANEGGIVSFEDVDGYSYKFTTITGETFDAEISFDTLDFEFIKGICEED